MCRGVWRQRQARAAHPKRSSASHVRVAEARKDGESVQQDQRRGATDGVDGAGLDHGGRWDVAGGEHGQRIRPLPSDGPSQARKGESGEGMKRGREDEKENADRKRNQPRLVTWTSPPATRGKILQASTCRGRPLDHGHGISNTREKMHFNRQKQYE